MSFSIYTHDFFRSFEMSTDVDGTRKACIQEPILRFLAHENFDTAREVYEGFFDCYRIKIEGDASFVDLLDKLLHYEKKAAVLLDKQRDHYVHSVNVFILGLSIFAQNKIYSDMFTKNVFETQNYIGRYDSPQEEFLFRWGLASLLHDIGYPVEITQNQIGGFIKFITSVDAASSANPFIEFKNFNALNSIDKIMYESAFAGAYPATASELDFYSPVDLLAHGICRTLPSVDAEMIKNTLRGYLQKMQSAAFVDHAFYSAVIMLKWYGFLAQKSGQGPGVFFYPVLDAATAIFLHNFYPHGLTKSPYNMPPLAAQHHPIAYLLMLCDELQDWNRVAYGTEDKKKILPQSIDIQICPRKLNIHYETIGGVLTDEFSEKKNKLFARILELAQVFPDGVNITSSTVACQTVKELEMNDIHSDQLLSRPTMEVLTRMAQKIHADYNAHQRTTGGNTLPNWSELDENYKYANIRQAKGAFAKLRLAGYECRDASLPLRSGYKEVVEFPAQMVEPLSILEHEDWVTDRKSQGWTYAAVRDNEKKHHPLLVPYDDLSEAEKDKDRNAVRNVFPLVHSIGLKVYEKKKDE